MNADQALAAHVASLPALISLRQTVEWFRLAGVPKASLDSVNRLRDSGELPLGKPVGASQQTRVRLPKQSVANWIRRRLKESGASAAGRRRA